MLQKDEETCLVYVLRWETISPVTASPKMIVMRSDKHDYRVLIQSRDNRMFRITSIECKVAGVRGRAANVASALAQTIEVDGPGDFPAARRPWDYHCPHGSSVTGQSGLTVCRNRVADHRCYGASHD